MNVHLFLHIALGGVILLFVARAVGKWIFTKDDKFEHIQEALLAVSAALRNYGLEMLADFCQKLAIKDFSRAFKMIVDFYNVLKGDPNAAIKMFDKSFERVLVNKLSNPESLAFIKSRVAEAEAHIVAMTPKENASLSGGVAPKAAA